MRKKLLWCGDSPTAASGFGRVSKELLSRLHLKYDISVLGINYWGDPHQTPYDIYPAMTGGDPYGANRIGNLAEQIKPDAIVLFGDLWYIKAWQQALLASDAKDIPRIGYFPIDGYHIPPNWTAVLPMLSKVATYTDFGVHQILSSASLCNNPELAQEIRNLDIRVIPHGVDGDTFRPIDRTEARKAVGMDSLPDDAFIFLNANTNQWRKRIDLCIHAFCKFLSRQGDVPAYLWMHMDDHTPDGWDIRSMMDIATRIHNVQDISRGKLIITYAQGGPRSLSADQLNLIYNACDVGVQTSQGEGWGLTTHEGFAVGRPQIVPNHSACAELWSDFTSLVHVGDPIVDRQSGITQYPPLIGAIAQNMAIEYAELRQRYSRQSLRSNAVKPEYQWDNIADQFLNLINESL